jgi:hypothetical protein
MPRVGVACSALCQLTWWHDEILIWRTRSNTPRPSLLFKRCRPLTSPDARGELATGCEQSATTMSVRINVYSLHPSLLQRACPKCGGLMLISEILPYAQKDASCESLSALGALITKSISPKCNKIAIEKLRQMTRRIVGTKAKSGACL